MSVVCIILGNVTLEIELLSLLCAHMDSCKNWVLTAMGDVSPSPQDLYSNLTLSPPQTL